MKKKIVYDTEIRKQGNAYCVPLRKYVMDMNSLNVGDRVRVIIIKEDEE